MRRCPYAAREPVPSDGSITCVIPSSPGDSIPTPTSPTRRRSADSPIPQLLANPADQVPDLGRGIGFLLDFLGLGGDLPIHLLGNLPGGEAIVGEQVELNSLETEPRQGRFRLGELLDRAGGLFRDRPEIGRIGAGGQEGLALG